MVTNAVILSKRMNNFHIFFLATDLFDDGLPSPAQAYLKVCSAMSEVGLHDMKTGSTPAILSSQEQEVLSSSGTTVQRRSVLRTEEIVSIFIE